MSGMYSLELTCHASIRTRMPLNFPSAKELRKHARRHWREFNLRDETCLQEYLDLACVFCDGPCPADVQECIRTCDTFVDRFRDSTGEFAVMMPNRTAILTFHVLYPLGTIGVERTHGFPSNQAYYDADCECLT